MAPNGWIRLHVGCGCGFFAAGEFLELGSLAVFTFLFWALLP
jgi:hypothetical protein